MPCRSITTELDGPADTLAARYCLWGPANFVRANISAHMLEVTRAARDLPEEQAVDLIHLSDSQDPSGNNHCNPRHTQGCIRNPMSHTSKMRRAKPHPSSSSAMLCCCPQDICTIFFSSKPLTGTGAIVVSIRLQRDLDGKVSHWARFQCQNLSGFLWRYAPLYGRCQAGPSLRSRMHIL